MVHSLGRSLALDQMFTTCVAPHLDQASFSCRCFGVTHNVYCSRGQSEDLIHDVLQGTRRLPAYPPCVRIVGLRACANNSTAPPHVVEAPEEGDLEVACWQEAARATKRLGIAELGSHGLVPYNLRWHGLPLRGVGVAAAAVRFEERDARIAARSAFYDVPSYDVLKVGKLCLPTMQCTALSRSFNDAGAMKHACKRFHQQ